MGIKNLQKETASLWRKGRNAIIGRGGKISPTAGLRDLPEAIYSIPADASLAFYTDEETQYRKIVPEKSQEFAMVKKIGGMTYKSKNLIPYPYANGTQTLNGVTWTPNANGSITANGTQTASVSYLIASFAEPLLLNGTYSASIGSTLPSGCSFYLTFNDDLGNVEIIKTSSTSSGKATITNRYCTSIHFWLQKGSVFNNVTFYPMLNLGSTAEEFEVQYKGLRDTAVTALKSEGVNRFNFNAPLRTSEQAYLTVIDNDTFTVTTKIATTGTAYNYISWEDIKIPKGATKLYIKVTATPTGKLTKGRVYARYRDASGTIGDTFQSDGKGELTVSRSIPSTHRDGDSYIRITWYVVSGDVSDAGDYIEYKNAMVSFDVDAPYTRYVGTLDTLDIPEAVKSLDGYGLGKNNDEYNYIDLANKVFKQEYGKVRIPSNTGGYNEHSNWYWITLGKMGLAPISREVLCDLLPSVELGANSGDGIYINANKDSLIIRNSKLTSAEEYRQWLADNEFYIVDRLAEPTETDITHLMQDNFIKVEGGGTITAENEFSYDSPSAIQYVINVG